MRFWPSEGPIISFSSGMNPVRTEICEPGRFAGFARSACLGNSILGALGECHVEAVSGSERNRGQYLNRVIWCSPDLIPLRDRCQY